MTPREVGWTAVLLVACKAGEPTAPPADAHVAVVLAPSPPPSIEDAAEIPADALRPCTSEGGGLDEARLALAALDARIDRLEDGPSAPTKPVVDAMKALLLTPCFELAGADLPDDELELDSGLALKRWWSDGGHDALAGYLSGKARLDRAVTPPLPRSSFFLDGNDTHVLAPLLCAASDATCGRGEAAGWYRRADKALERRMPNADDELEACEAHVRNEPPLERWSAFRACRLERTPYRSVLPLGRFRAPADGLFAVASGSSHCWALDVYDLATGAAYRTACGSTTAEVGRVSVSALREAVWMIALSSLASEIHRPADRMDVPAEILPVRPRDGSRGARFGIGGLFASTWSQEWTWLRARKGRFVGQVSGEVMSGPSPQACEHASDLLAVTNTSFVKGCAPSLSPAVRSAVDWSQPGRRAYHPDNPPFDFERPDLAAPRTAFETAKMPQICGPLP
ncbi:MAG: hypothetical protein KIT84_29675 [Labilithrix sp.]|nr:hypothetical protein [Labilithrix sp.]MCW5815233.1 hypothetical protein [Labilithrix sp.]